MKGKQMSLPKKIYVIEQGEGDEKWLSANLSAEDAVEGDESDPSVVGTYELVETRKLKLERAVSLVEQK